MLRMEVWESMEGRLEHRARCVNDRGGGTEKGRGASSVRYEKTDNACVTNGGFRVMNAVPEPG